MKKIYKTLLIGIPVLIVVVLFAATGSVIIYKMADIDVE